MTHVMPTGNPISPRTNPSIDGLIDTAVDSPDAIHLGSGLDEGWTATIDKAAGDYILRLTFSGMLAIGELDPLAAIAEVHPAIARVRDTYRDNLYKWSVIECVVHSDLIDGVDA